MDKVVASAAEAVADIASGSTHRGGRLRAVRHPVGADRRAAGAGRGRAGGGVEQLRCRRVGSRAAAVREADPADDLLLRGGEQGVRAAVPARGARGRADPAGHAGRADACRWHGHPRVLHRDRGRHAGGRGRAAVAVRLRRQRGRWPRRRRRCGPSRRPRATRSSCSRRRSSPTSGWCGPGRATGTATWCSASPRGTSTRWRRCAAGSRSPRSSTWSSRARSTPDEVHTPGVFVQRVVELTPEQAADKRIEKRTVPAAAAEEGA